MLHESITDYKLFTKVDAQYLRDEPVWRAKLASGPTVFRKEITGEEDSWLRLKRYLADNPEDYIEDVVFSFRDHFETVDRVKVSQIKDAWFFTNVVGCWYGSSPQYSWKGGYLAGNGDELYILKFSIPELINDEYETRSVDDPTIQRGIIWKNNLRPNVIL